MEKFLEKKYFIIGGIIILIGLLGLLYFVINRSDDGYTNLNETKEEETKEVSVENTIVVEVKGEVVNPGVYTLSENSIINDLINQAGGLTENAYTDNINLSKKLKDEMVVIIYKKSDIAKKTATTITKTTSQTNKVTSTTKSNITSDSCVTSTSDITECTDNTKSVIEVGDDSTTASSSAATSTTSSASTTGTTSTSSTPKIVNINTATLSELMTLKGIGESKAKKIIEYREKTKFTTPQDITKVSGIGNSTYENIKEYITV